MSEEAVTPSKRQRQTTWPALLIACAIAFIWSFFQAVSHEPDAALREADLSYKLGYLLGGVVGQSVVIALLIWLVLYFAHVRKRDADRGAPHFLALLGSAMGGGLVFVALVVAAVTGPGESEATAAVIDEYGAAVVALDSDLAEDVTSVTGLGGVVDTIDGREDLPEARAQLEALLPRIDEGEADVQALQAETIRRLQGAGASDRALEQYREDLTEANALRARATRLMRNIVETNLAQVTVLQEAGTWRIASDDRFEFDRASDSEAFNVNARRLMDLAAEGQALQAEVEAHQARNGQDQPEGP